MTLIFGRDVMDKVPIVSHIFVPMKTDHVTNNRP